MTEQTFTILGDPRGQGRPRTAVIKGHAVVYDSKEDRENKGNIRAQVASQAPHCFEKGKPLRLSISAFFGRPQSHFRTNGQVKDSAPVFHTSRPDADNVMKAVKDALKGVCWHDDAQIVEERIGKVYGDNPKMIITVGEM